MAQQGFWRRVQQVLFDPVAGTTSDLESNHDKAALATLSAAGAGTTNGTDQTNVNGRGVQVVVDITAISGTSPTLTVKVQGKDKASGKYYDLLASAALNATGTTLLTVYPGAPVTANVSASQALPAVWRVVSTVGGTSPSVTATVGASVIV